MTIDFVPSFGGSNILDALRWRYATKLFDTARAVPPDDLQTILEAIRLAPTSSGLQPFHVSVVSATETKAALRQAAYNQEQVATASHVLVFSAKPNIEDHAEKLFAGLQQGGAPDEAVATLRKYYRIGKIIRTLTFSRKSWAARQAYIALGFATMTAAGLGLDACPMEGFSARKVAKILHLPDGVHPVALLCLGYRSPTDKLRPKYRLPLEEIVN